MYLIFAENRPSFQWSGRKLKNCFRRYHIRLERCPLHFTPISFNALNSTINKDMKGQGNLSNSSCEHNVCWRNLLSSTNNYICSCTTKPGGAIRSRRTHILGRNAPSHLQIFLSKRKAMVTSAKPAPGQNGKFCQITEHRILSLFSSFMVWEEKAFLLFLFLLCGAGRKARSHQARHKAEAKFSLDWRNKHHFKLHCQTASTSCRLSDLFWIFLQKHVNTARFS